MGKKRIKVTDVNYNQEHLVEVDEKDFPTPAGVVIQVEEDVTLTSPNPSWVVPKLTAEQVTQAYNGLVAGKSVVVENADGTVQYPVVLGDGLTEEPAIMLVHYWLGFIDYQISNDEVTITGHELGGSQPVEPEKITLELSEDNFNEDENAYIIDILMGKVYNIVVPAQVQHEDSYLRIQTNKGAIFVITQQSGLVTEDVLSEYLDYESYIGLSLNSSEGRTIIVSYSNNLCAISTEQDI